MPSIKPRPYQTAAIDGLRARIREGLRRLLLVAPTGAGKTVIASLLIQNARERQSKIIFLAHRKELITQCSAKLDALGVDHGIIMADHPRWKPHAAVQVASVATLSRRLENGRVKFDPDIVFIDEAHHARAETYTNIVAAYPRAIVIGLTATPWRSDGKGLGNGLFQDIVVAATVQELIDSGALVKPKGFVYQQPDLSEVKTARGDYDLETLGEVMGKVILGGDIVRDYVRDCPGKRAVVFAVNVKHSREMIVPQFLEAGIPAEHLDDQTPPLERDAILARIRDGKTLVVSNVGILTEGWDCPAVEVCILARPTKSLALALQMMGRVLRPSPGKTCARIHDHAGVMLTHGRPQDPREYELEGDKPPSPAPQKTCKECFCINPAAATECQECGCVFEVQKGQKGGIEHREGIRLDMDDLRAERAANGIRADLSDEELERVSHATRQDKAAEYLRLRAVQESKGFKPGWVAHQYRGVFGVWPKFAANDLEGVTPAARSFISLPKRPHNDNPGGQEGTP